MKSWYGASLTAGKPLIVLARRSFAGRIIYNSTVEPATWQSPAPPALVAGCIGIHESITLWLDTPLSSKSKVVGVLPAMLDVQLPFQINDCCYCFVRFKKNQSGNLSALAVAARRANVVRKIQEYRAAGLDPLIIDHEGLALWDAGLHEKPPRTETTRVIICLEKERASFVIGKDREYFNSHCLRLSTDPGQTAEPEEIYKRMHRVLRAELQAAASVEWLFCGSIARQPAFVGGLHRLLGADWPGPLTVCRQPDLILSQSLARRALIGKAANCNLRQGDLAHPGLQNARKRFKTLTFTLFLTAGLFLCVCNLVWQVAAEIMYKAARNEIAHLAGKIAPGAAIPYGRESEEAAKLVQKREEEFAPALHVFERPLPERLAEIIKAGKECRLAFTRLELTRSKIILSGTADDWNDCEHLEKRLRSFGYQTELERKEAPEDGPVRFDLKGTGKP